MYARIFKPSKDASQSGMAGTKKWLMVFEQEKPRSSELLMGWTSSGDTRQQVRLAFSTQEEAVEYAQKNGIAYRLEKAREPKRRIASYSDNFKADRISPWTH